MSLKTSELQAMLRPLRDHYVGRTYQHYRGGVYKVLGVVFDTFHDKPAIRYARVDGMHFNQLAEADIEFTRLLEDWESSVSVKTPEGFKNNPRFLEVVKQELWKRV